MSKKFAGIICIVITGIIGIVVTSLMFRSSGDDEAGPKIELPEGSAVRGEEIYGKTCAMCHGPDGNADTQVGKRLGVKKLTNASRMSAFSDEDIVNTVQNGKGKMPGFGKKLTLQELADTIEFVRGLSGK